MEYTTLGATGTEVSKICVGTWRFGREHDAAEETTRKEAHELLDIAYDKGVNFIDTADRYGDPPGTAEEYLGDWLADVDREQFVIASKVGLPYRDRPNFDGLSRKAIRRQVEGTLSRLGTDYLDLYYIHRLDDRTPTAETLSTLHRLVEEGKVRHLGASTMVAWELAKLCYESEIHGWEKIAVTQPPVDATLQNWKRYDRFNLHRYLEVCKEQNLGVLPYSPLAGGFLTGKYDRGAEPPAGSRKDMLTEDFQRKYLSEQAWEVLDVVREVADEADTTPARVALRWVMEQDQFPGGMVPITSVRTPDQLRDNLCAVDVSLSDDQLDRIDDARDEPFLP
jgi:aryl-alcohol dehydrogenase-like predicted oxidoreductase